MARGKDTGSPAKLLADEHQERERLEQLKKDRFEWLEWQRHEEEGFDGVEQRGS